jgi:methylenetetrahydrofolate dehydrogenase (NADP+)/methenyltetrahydrofolate cyclohydrolase
LCFIKKIKLCVVNNARYTAVTMLVDGRAIAEHILHDVAEKTATLSSVPQLGVVTCAPGPETRQYLELKKRKAAAAGIKTIILELPATATTQDCIDCVNRLAEESEGIVVQLPLPAHIEREQVLSAVPVTKDPDGFAYGVDERASLPPVAGAVKEIATQYAVDFTGKKVAVVGYGRLVGKPSTTFAEAAGADVVILEEGTPDYLAELKSADIIITGVGKAHFITPEMVKEGVVVFDAGASEDGGLVVGDVHPDVAEQASLFTPVPGGIGPITVALLLRNLLDNQS